MYCVGFMAIIGYHHVLMVFVAIGIILLCEFETLVISLPVALWH